MQRWVYKLATATARMEGGLSVVTITGVVTNETAALILQDNAQWLGRSGALAQIACYRGACLAIDPQALLSSASAVLSVNPTLETPTALLISESRSVWDTYCTLMASQGIARAPFGAFDAGLSWAAGQAVVLAEMRRGSGRAACGTAPPSPGLAAAGRSRAPTSTQQG